jgi:protein unc-45
MSSPAKNVAPGSSDAINNQSLEDQMLLLIAKLMEGGQEDEETCRTLDNVTKLLTEGSSDHTSHSKISKTLHELIDADGFETILGYLDIRRGDTIRGHAALTLSVYLKASQQDGAEYLSDFFKTRVGKGTYDDFISAFSVAASVFPIAPSISADLFLSEGFVNSLGSLMKRKWKSKKVEQALLEMLNAACMDTACREAIRKYCLQWLEEIVAEQPHNVGDPEPTWKSASINGGSVQQRTHSEKVRNLAAVILAKLQVSVLPPTRSSFLYALLSECFCVLETS